MPGSSKGTVCPKAHAPRLVIAATRKTTRPMTNAGSDCTKGGRKNTVKVAVTLAWGMEKASAVYTGSPRGKHSLRKRTRTFCSRASKRNGSMITPSCGHDTVHSTRAAPAV